MNIHKRLNKDDLSNVSPSSGLPVQLDRVLPLLLSDQYHRRTLRSHLRLWPFPHQVDSYRQGMFSFEYLAQLIQCVGHHIGLNIRRIEVFFVLFLNYLLQLN